MATTARICGFAVIALATTLSGPLAETARSAQAIPIDPILCRAPVAKAYQIRPEFCAQQIVALIQQSGPSDDSCGCCGPYGIPPVYTAGNNVVVRTSPEVHARIAKFLADLGVTVPRTIGTP